MEFNKIAGAILVSVLAMLLIGKVGNTLVPPFTPLPDKPGAAAPTTPETTEPEKPVAELLAVADAAEGARRLSACTSCHTFTKGGANGQGPNLYDVVGRAKGSVPGFPYSPGMKAAGGTWTYEELFQFIGNPGSVIKDTKMQFRLPRAEFRAAIIAHLRTLSDAPKPLPVVEKKTEAPKAPDAPKAGEPAKPAEAPKAEPPKPEPTKTEPAKPAEPAPAEAPKAAPAPAAPPAAEPPKAEPPKAADPAPAPPNATPPAPPAEKKD